MSENSKTVQEGESKKIGDVNLKGIIDGIEIRCNVDLMYKIPKEKENEASPKLPKKLQNKHYFFYFILPFIIILICFLIDLILDYSSHIILFILPLTCGVILYNMFTNSPSADLAYVKKYVDFITLSSSTLTACLLLFKTVDSYNPYVEMIYHLKDHGLIGIFSFLIIFTLVYFIIWIFATSATIKCLFSLRELLNENKKK
ncbi:hypothetical protein [Rahnella selenatireducens]|uniref:hypothetical protein n=1 Tax=Rahnella selenatireducens TaxID=3389797 RepID=UPI003969A642